VATTTLIRPPAPGRHRPVPPPRSRPRWERRALLALLAGTALLYLWNLSASGYANDFYAAAVQAGTQSWKAWLFGSLDSGNAITVDKPPASLWVMTLSARIFGFNSWSLLVPQALMGVASVALLCAAVRRWAGPVAGLLAGAALALAPAAVLMFRFDNPDALLVLLTRLRTRLLQLLAALGSMIVSAGWFIALVELWPADSRPYIGGSTTNSLLELALGHNGLGRLLGGSGTAAVAVAGTRFGGGQGGGPGGDSDSTSSQIAEWVAANYTATTVGGQTVYDLQG
jgi:Dolichyl-phosphate-mannose-protein mannosyltransferase